jgi:hypothetical protein
MITKSEKRSYTRLLHTAEAFWIHIAAFIIVIGFMWLVWLFEGGVSTYIWPVYPSGVWGIVLVAHYFLVLGKFGKRKLKNKT